MTRTALTPHSVGIPPKRDEPKPIVEFWRGALWQLDSGHYKQVTPEAVRVLRWSLSHYPESHAQRIKDIDTALAQHEQENA